MWIHLLDILAWAVAMALILRRPTLVAMSAQLRPARRLALLALVLAIPAGQVIHRSESTYPFVAWAMYTESRPGNVAYLEYTLILADSSEVELPVARMYDRIGKKLVWRLDRLERAGSLAICDRVLSDLGHRYNEGHGSNPAVSIRIWDAVVPMTARSADAMARRTPRRSINL